MGWITVNGRHIEIKSGESKSSAIKRATGHNKRSKVKKAVSGREYQYNKAKKEYDKKIKKLQDTYLNKPSKFMDVANANANNYNRQSGQALNKLIKQQGKTLTSKKAAYKPVKKKKK